MGRRARGRLQLGALAALVAAGSSTRASSQPPTETLRLEIDGVAVTATHVRAEPLRYEDDGCPGTWYSIVADAPAGAPIEACTLELRLGPPRAWTGPLRESGCPAVSAALTWSGGDHALVHGEVSIAWTDVDSGAVVLTIVGTSSRAGREIAVRGEAHLRLPEMRR